MPRLYLTLAVLGAVVPWIFFAQHFAAAGPSLPGFLAAGFANPAASGLTADLVITSAVFWAYLFGAGEGRRALYLIPVNLLIGLSCALPLYLYLRSRPGAAAAPSVTAGAAGAASPHVG